MAISNNWRSRLVANLEGDVLEIGVGSGDNLLYYRRARHVWGIEPDPKRAAKARARAARSAVPMTIDVATAEDLPYTDHSFDVVVSSLVFCSVTDPVLALREVQRVLRPGGVMHMREHIRPKSNFWAGVATTLTPVQRRLFANCHLNRPTLEIMRGEGWHVELLAQKTVLVSVRATPPQ
jgi:ubiquinone/menaquinone biosynthesis C-methylase UbiE